MKELTTKDMLKNVQDRQNRLIDGVSKLKRTLANAGVPEAYKDKRCKSSNQWVYLYPDGHEELVEINTASMISTKVKE